MYLWHRNCHIIFLKSIFAKQHVWGGVVCPWVASSKLKIAEFRAKYCGVFMPISWTQIPLFYLLSGYSLTLRGGAQLMWTVQRYAMYDEQIWPDCNIGTLNILKWINEWILAILFHSGIQYIYLPIAPVENSSCFFFFFFKKNMGREGFWKIKK